MPSDTTERIHFHFSLSYIGEGNGNPLQCSCLENPRDRGAWWAAISGVAQSRTRLKQLSSSSSSSSSMPSPQKSDEQTQQSVLLPFTSDFGPEATLNKGCCCYGCCLVIKSCLTFCDLMDCSSPASSVHGISQAIILEWVAISFSRGSS